MIATITVKLDDSAADHGAIALIAPLGIDTESQAFQSFDPPHGWQSSVVAERRTGQLAAIMTPPNSDARAHFKHRFRSGGRGLSPAAFEPERTSLTIAADELAAEARSIAEQAGGGRAGIAAIVSDTSKRFTYGQLPENERWYYGCAAVPTIACGKGNCIDINTFLVAALRAAGNEAVYLTCYFFAHEPSLVTDGMHCWVRTRCDGVVEDWDIAHFKKVGREDVHAILNPIPGQRWALAYGRNHIYDWNGLAIEVPTPSKPMWVLPDGKAIWLQSETVTFETN